MKKQNRRVAIFGIIIILVVFFFYFMLFGRVTPKGSYIIENLDLIGSPQALSISGDTAIPPESSRSYKLIFDTRSICYGDYQTDVDWDSENIGNGILIDIKQPNQNPSIQGAYYSSVSFITPKLDSGIDLQMVYIIARYACNKGSGEERIKVTVASQCYNQCSKVEQKTCIDSRSNHECISKNGCLVWGGVGYAQPDYVCKDGNFIVKQVCNFGERVCINSKQFKECRSDGLYYGEIYCRSDNYNTQYCTGAGRCVECSETSQCSSEKECINNVCRIKEEIKKCEPKEVECGGWSNCLNDKQDRVCSDTCNSFSKEQECSEDNSEDEDRIIIGCKLNSDCKVGFKCSKNNCIKDVVKCTKFQTLKDNKCSFSADEFFSDTTVIVSSITGFILLIVIIFLVFMPKKRRK